MLNNLTNFFNLIASRKVKTSVGPNDLVSIGVPDPRTPGIYQPAAIKACDLGGSGIIAEGTGAGSSLRINANNTTSGAYSTVLGECNTIVGSPGAIIAGGTNNEITGNSSASFNTLDYATICMNGFNGSFNMNTHCVSNLTYFFSGAPDWTCLSLNSFASDGSSIVVSQDYSCLTPYVGCYYTQSKLTYCNFEFTNNSGNYNSTLSYVNYDSGTNTTTLCFSPSLPVTSYITVYNQKICVSGSVVNVDPNGSYIEFAGNTNYFDGFYLYYPTTSGQKTIDGFTYNVEFSNYTNPFTACYNSVSNTTKFCYTQPFTLPLTAATNGYSTILNGCKNRIDASDTAILMGSGNTITACCSIANGVGNVITTTNSNILSGAFNVIACDALPNSQSGGYYNGFSEGQTTLASCFGDLTGYYTPGSTVSSQYLYGYPDQCNYFNMVVCGSSYDGTSTTICVDSSINTCSGYIIKTGTFSTYSAYHPNVIAGGAFNTINCYTSAATISGGYHNSISGGYGTISGGYCNSDLNGTNTIAGGFRNTTNTYGSAITGGRCNTTTGMYSSASGYRNTVSGSNTHAIGSNLIASRPYTTYVNDLIIDTFKTCAGCSITVGANGLLTAGSGGGGSIVVEGCGIGTTLRCGNGNIVSGNYSTIIGGKCNTISSYSSFIGSAVFSNISGGKSMVASGSSNTASGYYSAVFGGYGNISSGIFSTVTGGANNIVSGDISFIGNGAYNNINATRSVILNGYQNTVCDRDSAILSGIGNTVSSYLSTIIGGCGSILSNYKSFIIGSDITSDRACTTFVNSLSIKTIPTSSAGLPSGMIWRCTADNTLRIVP